MQDMKNPILGILIGADFTAIVQSSAATLGIIIALAGEGLMPHEAGVGFVHLLFNVSGVLFFVFFIPQLAEFVRFISPAALELEDLARLAAETRRQVAKLAEFVIPARPDDAAEAGDVRNLDEASPSKSDGAGAVRSSRALPHGVATLLDTYATVRIPPDRREARTRRDREKLRTLSRAQLSSTRSRAMRTSKNSSCPALKRT
jgi:hypothetical protein